MVACQSGHVSVVQALLKRKEIQINQAENDGLTPLMFACLNGHVHVVQALLKRNEIQVNQASNDGATPLYVACETGQVSLVAVLLEAKNIDVDKAVQGWTPIMVAQDEHHVEVVALLQQYGSSRIDI